MALPIRPPIMYHGFFIYLMWDLFDIKKITFVPHVWASNGRIKRNTKKSSIFGITAKIGGASWDRRCSKQPKIG